jgi:Uncharacterised protein family (UPF0164)
MKRTISYIFILGLLFGSAQTSLAVVGDAGTNNPFELGAGSRALAMAGAFTAVADDATSIFWNPGGLAQLEQIEVAAMHIDLFFDTPYDFFGLAYPILDWGTISIGAVRIATEGVVLRDERSRIIGSGEGSLDLREYLIGYSREVIGDFRAGIVIKIDQQRLLGDFDTGVGMDLGFHYSFPEDLLGVSGFDWENLRVGLAFQNLFGSQLRLGEVTDILPLYMKAGLAYQFQSRDSLQQKILISTAWEKSTWRTSQFSAGLEYSLLDMIFVRGGIHSAAWTLGGGVKYIGIALDYALAGEELGMTHRFTLSYRFGTPLFEQRALRESQRQEELEREAQARSEEATEQIREDMEKALRKAERRHGREKRALRANQQRQLNAERLRQIKQRKAALADEYFKAYHYFQGIKDYLAKNYQHALVEFETVAKYDANYLELPLYLERAKQRIDGTVEFMSQTSYDLYFKGIDYYVANRFAAAIRVWDKILGSEPNNILVLRNIDEAKERIAKLEAVKALQEQQKSVETLEKKPETPSEPQPEVVLEKSQDQKETDTKP